ncbi:hypothetical protein E2C01_086744 [Portunus trituberculatus]|uniref:Uncharacterized protein n=1 Tax=Portunus trituberculatus TaxID=210409 RepID=A0A5B7JA45_PORTR|nr:hypothetical protein [Portunus trituberculatus]
MTVVLVLVGGEEVGGRSSISLHEAAAMTLCMAPLTPPQYPHPFHCPYHQPYKWRKMEIDHHFSSSSSPEQLGRIYLGWNGGEAAVVVVVEEEEEEGQTLDGDVWWGFGERLRQLWGGREKRDVLAQATGK